MALWYKYLILGNRWIEMLFSRTSSLYLLVAAGAIGIGYAGWNVSIRGGSVTALAGAYYFIPVTSFVLHREC